MSTLRSTYIHKFQKLWFQRTTSTYCTYFVQVFVSSLDYIYPYLKVVYKEKQGGSARWLLLVMSMGHRRSRFIFLNFAVVFSSTYFPFPPSTDKILGDAHWTGTSILACLNTNEAPMVSAPLVIVHQFQTAKSAKHNPKFKGAPNSVHVA